MLAETMPTLTDGELTGIIIGSIVIPFLCLGWIVLITIEYFLSGTICCCIRPRRSAVSIPAPNPSSGPNPSPGPSSVVEYPNYVEVISVRGSGKLPSVAPNKYRFEETNKIEK